MPAATQAAAMPSRGFFPYHSAYDPYAHNRAAPSYGHLYGPLLSNTPPPPQPTTAYGHLLYGDPYCSTASRAMGYHRTGGDSLFPAAWWDADAEPAEVVQMLRAAANRKPPRPLGIPIHIDGLDAEPPVGETTEAAAVRVQAAARGFLARRLVRAVRQVEREAGAVGRIVAEKAAALGGKEDAAARARVAAGEVLMKMLLRLDALRGAREYRRRVSRLVLAVQDAVDALDPMAAPPPPGPEAEADEERETSPGDADVRVVVEPQDLDADGEWEMVEEEPAAALAEAPCQEHSEQEVTRAAAAGGLGGVDTVRLVEMVVALCEQSAQQCAVMSALVERLDALERAVRQMEEAEW